MMKNNAFTQDGDDDTRQARLALLSENIDTHAVELGVAEARFDNSTGSVLSDRTACEETSTLPAKRRRLKGWSILNNSRTD